MQNICVANASYTPWRYSLKVRTHTFRKT